jgi:hypothetical protein
VPVLGGKVVRISNISVLSTQNFIVRLGSLHVPGSFLDSSTVEFKSPVLAGVDSGIEVALSVDGGKSFPLRGAKVASKSNVVFPPQISGVESGKAVDASQDLVVSYDVSSLLGTESLDAVVYQFHSATSTYEVVGSQTLGAVAQDGQAVISSQTLSNISTKGQPTLLIRIENSQESKVAPEIYSQYFTLKTSSSDTICRDWLSKENPLSSDLIPDCPCTLAQALVDPRHFVDHADCHGNRTCGQDKGTSCDVYPNAYHCLKSVSQVPRSNFTDGVGSICCYLKSGALMRDIIPGSGHSYNSAQSLNPDASFFADNLSPYYHCCLSGGADAGSSPNCVSYFQKRPVNKCTRYTSPSIGLLVGATKVNF